MNVRFDNIIYLYNMSKEIKLTGVKVDTFLELMRRNVPGSSVMIEIQDDMLTMFSISGVGIIKRSIIDINSMAESVENPFTDMVTCVLRSPDFSILNGCEKTDISFIVNDKKNTMISLKISYKPAESLKPMYITYKNCAPEWITMIGLKRPKDQHFIKAENDNVIDIDANTEFLLRQLSKMYKQTSNKYIYMYTKNDNTVNISTIRTDEALNNEGDTRVLSDLIVSEAFDKYMAFEKLFSFDIDVKNPTELEYVSFLEYNTLMQLFDKKDDSTNYIMSYNQNFMRIESTYDSISTTSIAAFCEINM